MKFVARTGWWTAGRFFRPVWRQEAMGRDFGTGFFVDSTEGSTMQNAREAEAFAFANENGIEAAAEKFPRVIVSRARMEEAERKSMERERSYVTHGF